MTETPYAQLRCTCPPDMPPSMYMPGCPACEAFAARLAAITRPCDRTATPPGEDAAMDTPAAIAARPGREQVAYLLYRWVDVEPPPWSRATCLRIAEDLIGAYEEYGGAGSSRQGERTSCPQRSSQTSA